MANEHSSKKHRSKETKDPGANTRTFTVVSLGCPKNLVDSEEMTGRLIGKGFHFLSEADRVGLVILNTCGFLASARQEAKECLRRLLSLKNRNMVQRVVVTGCIIPFEKESLSEEFPDVDLWLGPFDEHQIAEKVEALFDSCNSNDNIQKDVPPPNGLPVLPVVVPTETKTSPESTATELPPAKTVPLDDRHRHLLTESHVAWLRIADGCNRFCSYCLIPSLRGRFVSKPMDAIEDEAKRLADQGVREVVLIAQETTFWGSDFYGKPRLVDLLAKLKEKSDFDWIRVLYTYPLHFDDDLLSLFGFGKASAPSEEAKTQGKKSTVILPYIDVPLQHCNDELLRRMNRRVSKSETEELLARLRETIPDLVLRTTMITGFPGETDAMFEELTAFMARWKFERAGVFAFSPEKGTAAAALPDQVPDKVRQHRQRMLYARQERITHQWARTKIGQTLDVLIDRQGTDENDQPLSDLYIGRTYADAPDIDPVVYVTGDNLTPGQLVPCEIVDVQELDLIAVPSSL